MGGGTADMRFLLDEAVLIRFQICLWTQFSGGNYSDLGLAISPDHSDFTSVHITWCLFGNICSILQYIYIYIYIYIWRWTAFHTHAITCINKSHCEHVLHLLCYMITQMHYLLWGFFCSLLKGTWGRKWAQPGTALLIASWFWGLGDQGPTQTGM